MTVEDKRIEEVPAPTCACLFAWKDKAFTSKCVYFLAICASTKEVTQTTTLRLHDSEGMGVTGLVTLDSQL